MALLTIRTFGDPVLRTPASDVVAFDDALRVLAGDMMETMHDAPGVGLAAPQVGVPRRMFTFDSGEESGVYCNPVVTAIGDETQEGEEGCLSLPGQYFPVVRAMRVSIRAQDLDGNALEREAEGFLARIFQHETDHTNGILFIDRLARDVRKEAMKALREGGLDPGRRPRAAPAL